jgi:arabinofuranosyltransferase
MWQVVRWAPTAVFAAGIWVHRWTAEDGFINLRIVKNLIDGRGFVYNIGQRVETGTSPLWIFVLTMWAPVRHFLSLELFAMSVAAVLAIAGFVFGQLGAEALCASDERRRLLPLGALVVAVLPPFWDFSTSGMEMGLGFGWLGASFWLLVRHATSPRLRWVAAVVVGLGPLIRPDFAVFTFGFTAALLALNWSGRHKTLVGLLAAVVAAPALYEVFRIWYFGLLIPAPGIAKEAGASNMRQGLTYLADFNRPYVILVPLVVIVAILQFARPPALVSTRNRVLAGTLWAAAALHAAWVVRLGGDYMHGRFLLPSLFVALLPVFAVPAAAAKAGAYAIVVAWAALVLTSARNHASRVGESGIVNERLVYVDAGQVRNPVEVSDFRNVNFYVHGAAAHDLLTAGIGDYFQSYVDLGLRTVGASPGPPGSGLIEEYYFLGVFGYVAGPHVAVYDPEGLADPIAGHQRVLVHTRPGHEKSLPLIWYLARFDANAENPADLATWAAISAPSDYVTRAELDNAKAALNCRTMRDLQAASTGPLGDLWGRFSRAWRLTFLRFDPDPAKARAELCGTTSAASASASLRRGPTAHDDRWWRAADEALAPGSAATDAGYSARPSPTGVRAARYQTRYSTSRGPPV